MSYYSQSPFPKIINCSNDIINYSSPSHWNSIRDTDNNTNNSIRDTDNTTNSLSSTTSNSDVIMMENDNSNLYQNQNDINNPNPQQLQINDNCMDCMPVRQSSSSSSVLNSISMTPSSSYETNDGSLTESQISYKYQYHDINNNNNNNFNNKITQDQRTDLLTNNNNIIRHDIYNNRQFNNNNNISSCYYTNNHHSLPLHHPLESNQIDDQSQLHQLHQLHPLPPPLPLPSISSYRPINNEQITEVEKQATIAPSSIVPEDNPYKLPSFFPPIETLSNITTNNEYNSINKQQNNETEDKYGDPYVYNSFGEMIGIMESNLSIINSNGIKCGLIRPINQIKSNEDVLLFNEDQIGKKTATTTTITNNIPNNNNIIEPKLEKNLEIISQINNNDAAILQLHINKNKNAAKYAAKPHICPICNKRYKLLCSLRSHQKIHTSEAFVCSYCNKRFGRKSNWKEHLRIHTGERPFKCHYCSKSFKQQHSFKEHLRIHTGYKPHVCSVCGKKFTVKHNLNVHLRIHTGERPYKCDICNKSYRQHSAYNSHKRNVHGKK